MHVIYINDTSHIHIVPIYNAIMAKSKKIPKVEKTAKSSEFQPFESWVKNPLFLILNDDFDDFSYN